MSRLRHIVTAIQATVVATALAAAMPAPWTHANGNPVSIVLSYLNGVSNTGSTNATGVAELVPREGEARVTVAGLSRLAGEQYVVWIMNSATNEKMAIGGFNVEENGVGKLENTTRDAWPDKGWDTVYLSIESAGSIPAQSSNRRAIAGKWPVPGTQQGQPGELPNTRQCAGRIARTDNCALGDRTGRAASGHRHQRCHRLPPGTLESTEINRMIRGFYNSSSSMVALQKRMEVATTNLANLSTSGFKQDRTAISTFAEQLVSRMTAGESVAQLGQVGLADVTAEPDTDWSQGSFQTTGRSLDLALSGGGFFTIQTPDGVRYTRNGGFTRNAQDLLITSTGRTVLGENGPIQLPDGEMSVASDGTIVVDDVVVDRLRLAEFDNLTDLRRFGNNELGPNDQATQPRTATTSMVHQGMVEASNVDVTATMTTIMEIQRAYEANQRMIQTQNELTQRAVSDIARPGA